MIAGLTIDFLGLTLENPFLLAASPCTDDAETVRRAFRAGWAGAVLKTTSLEGTAVDLAYPMITGVEYAGQKLWGMGNIDLISVHHIDEVERRIGALKAEFPGKGLIGSIMAATQRDWTTLASRLSRAGADLIECSFSCPQGSPGSRPGFMLGQDPRLVEQVTSSVKEGAGQTPVLIKITPQVADIVEVAEAAQKGGADGLTASNTVPALLGVDLESFVPYPQIDGRSTYSGLSGPAIKPITLRVIAEIARRLEIPISGTGGASDWRDAAQFMLVGASNVQYCTAPMHYGFRIIDHLCDGMLRYLRRKGFSSPSELVGRALPHLGTHDELPRRLKVKSRINKKLCLRDDLCFIACQDGGHQAIHLGRTRLPSVDVEKCVGCGLCQAICPVEGCIKLQSV